MTWIKRHKLITIISVFAYGFFIALFSIRLNGIQIILKGDLTNVSNQITVKDKPDSDAFYSIYVLSMDRPTLFQYLISKLDKKIEVEDIPKGFAGYTLEDYYMMGQVDEVISFQNALTTAYKKASSDPNIVVTNTLQGYLIDYVDKRQTGLKIGDLLVSVNDLPFDKSTIGDYIEAFTNNNIVDIILIRGQERISHRLYRIPETNQFGFSMSPKYQVLTTPTYQKEFQADLVGGPSGGLIQTLKIYTDLMALDLKDIKVTGTGTMSATGIVGPVGGIKQKVYTAYDHDIDIFFVPNENYDDALEAYNQLKNPSFMLIKVGDFDEAVEKLLFHLSDG